MALGDRALPADVDVLPGTDLDDVWQRFEVFEALHHGMRICNPLTERELADLVQALPLSDGASVLDMACGYGELLLRCASVAAIDGVGIDLSPWMVQTAARRAATSMPDAQLRWVVGEARDYGREQSWDVVTCLGAEWIWHDFNGTARALAGLVRPGGVVVVSAARLKDGQDAAAVAEKYGRVETVADQAAMLGAHGLELLTRFDPDDAAWDAYLARTTTSISEWALKLPAERSADYVAAQREWLEARERDRDIIGWSAWVTRAVA